MIQISHMSILKVLQDYNTESQLLKGIVLFFNNIKLLPISGK
jgi:hypothetical protein